MCSCQEGLRNNLADAFWIFCTQLSSADRSPCVCVCACMCACACVHKCACGCACINVGVHA